MRNKLDLKIFIFIGVNEIVDSFAQILMKKGLCEGNGEWTDVAGALGFLSGHSPSLWVWSGIFLYASNFFIWIIILAHLDLNLAVPLTSINYILLPVMTLFLLNEKINILRWVGIIFIAAGVYFVFRSAGSKAPEPHSA